MLYFDCHAKIGQRPLKHKRTRWSTEHLLADMDLAELSGELVRHAMSLVGTEHNCAGGITPHDTWISCEESVVGPGNELGRARVHGWCAAAGGEAAPSRGPLLRPLG